MDEYPAIDPGGPELVYMVVAEHIAARIGTGELKVGQRLPAEVDLAQAYGVARMTIRRAMTVLRARGLVKTIHGKGTYVTVPDEPRA